MQLTIVHCQLSRSDGVQREAEAELENSNCLHQQRPRTSIFDARS